MKNKIIILIIVIIISVSFANAATDKIVDITSEIRATVQGIAPASSTAVDIPYIAPQCSTGTLTDTRCTVPGIVMEAQQGQTCSLAKPNIECITAINSAGCNAKCTSNAVTFSASQSSYYLQDITSQQPIIKLGEQTQIQAQTIPSGGIISFISSDSNIASVDNTGKVTSKSKGKVTITAKLDIQSKRTEITVNAEISCAGSAGCVETRTCQTLKIPPDQYTTYTCPGQTCCETQFPILTGLIITNSETCTNQPGDQVWCDTGTKCTTASRAGHDQCCTGTQKNQLCTTTSQVNNLHQGTNGCETGWCNCNSNFADGCEILVGTESNSCPGKCPETETIDVCQTDIFCQGKNFQGGCDIGLHKCLGGKEVRYKCESGIIYSADYYSIVGTQNSVSLPISKNKQQTKICTGCQEGQINTNLNDFTCQITPAHVPQTAPTNCNDQTLGKTKCESQGIGGNEISCSRKRLGNNWEYYWDNTNPKACPMGCNPAKTACFEGTGSCTCDGTQIGQTKSCTYTNTKQQRITGAQTCKYHFQDSTCSLEECTPTPTECVCEGGKKVGQTKTCESITQSGISTITGTQECKWDANTKSCSFEQQCIIAVGTTCNYYDSQNRQQDCTTNNGKSGQKTCYIDGTWSECLLLTDPANAPISCIVDATSKKCQNNILWTCRGTTPKSENCPNGCDENGNMACKVKSESNALSTDCESCETVMGTTTKNYRICASNEKQICEDTQWIGTKLCVKHYPYSCSKIDSECQVISTAFQKDQTKCNIATGQPQQPNQVCEIPNIKVMAAGKDVTSDVIIQLLPSTSINSGSLKIMVTKAGKTAKVEKTCTCAQGKITC